MRYALLGRTIGSGFDSTQCSGAKTGFLEETRLLTVGFRLGRAQVEGLKKPKTLDVMKLSEDKRQEYQRYLENLHYEASMAHTYEAIKEEVERKVRREVQKELASGYRPQDAGERLCD